MLTGFGGIPLAVEAVKEGADMLLTKPVDAEELLSLATDLRARPRQQPLPRGALSFNLGEVEREGIRAALKESGGNIARAAQLLGIDRRTLQRKLKKSY